MPAKLDRCVSDIKAKGDADGVNPHAVCNASINEAHNPFESNSMDVSAGNKETLNPQDRLDKTNPQPRQHANPHKTLDPEPSNIGHSNPRKTLDPEPKHDGHRNPREPLDPKMNEGCELDKIEQEAVAIGGGLSAQSVGGKRHIDNLKEGGPGSGPQGGGFKGKGQPTTVKKRFSLDPLPSMVGQSLKAYPKALGLTETICPCEKFDNVLKSLRKETS